jgi:hypothetical protein
MVKPYSLLDGEDSKQRRRRSNKQEKTLARQTGGRAQAGSGAVWSAKGDTKDKGHFLDTLKAFLHECKFTAKASFSLSTKLWDEISEKAFREGRKPAMEIKLNAEAHNELDLIVLSKSDYLELRGDGE